MIEGAKMLVCGECAKLGSVSWESKTEPRMKKIAKRLPQPMIAPRRQPSIVVEESVELVDDFGAKIRQAREKLGLDHEDLGKKISEKVSVLRKIESSKMAPNNLLVEKLQHALKVKLMVPVSEPKVPSKVLVSSRPSAPTLGDIAQVKKEKEKRG
jgi:putative transcription factor